ncbi:hypothetical protein AUEXF2481DRAFT_6963 [Aureobasidium subglaciale EXF-2481]|uniref:FAD-binding domain-containing protein n=1 Tax=Aureobasidium subglaciale (strain EXF-2481) TaxID=1043005 RepID=A0A074Y5B9_AURSE|nr:uncharacterized protein AUEXF2481DRAFT_6963 [Aureobasidium subglaciale EXF-2481]KEQ92998.1 hypothetical protein AUEXF2481DRAFT_6963 [Aureobasidium subglaciale EXF-2481]
MPGQTFTTTEQPTPGSSETLETTPVLVVGAEPTGLLLAYLLSKLGIESIVIEKYPERLGAPKDHALSPRSLEICRQFGLDTIAIRKLGTPRTDAYWVNFVTNLSGDQVGRLPYERMGPATLKANPEMIHNIPQPVFEQYLTDQLSGDPRVELRTGIAFITCTQDSGGVVIVWVCSTYSILSYRPWLLSRKVAKQYNIANVLLAGDAAHSFPPTAGLGLNSGIADVHNIAYTIAAVQ